MSHVIENAEQAKWYMLYSYSSDEFPHFIKEIEAAANRHFPTDERLLNFARKLYDEDRARGRR